MRKRIVSILLTLCMLLCIMPTAAFAEGTPTGTALTQENISNYKHNSGGNYSENGVYLPAGSYYLAEDIYLVGDDTDPNSAWPLIISEGAVTLDLNGHVLDLKKKDINIHSAGILTLTDSNPQAEHKFRVEDSGLWVLDESGDKTVAGGVITGGTGANDGTYGNVGGGVQVFGNSFTMEGGSIVGCTANNGGGVSVLNYGSFTMKDGRIAGCTAVKSGNSYGNGGGVSVFYGGSFTMKGGSITDCTAANGGGVFVAGGSFTMKGGSITSCTAGGEPNAVHTDGSFTDTNSKIDKSLVTGIKAGHAGTEADPILIATPKGLEDFRDRVNNGETSLCAKLTADIVLNDGTFDENGTYTGANGSTSAEQWTPISNGYRGTFDGNGKTIRGLYINGLNEHCGLFGLCGSCTIRNLTVTGYVCTSANMSVGGIVGFAGPSPYITNCQNSCTVKGGDRVGGIAGAASSNAHISGCSNSGRISGIAAVGGIVGDLWGISGIKNCSNIGAVTGTGDAVYVGGLAGRSSDSEISNSYSVGALSGSGNQVYVGGIAGEMSGRNGRITYSCWLEDTAEEAAGDNTVYKIDVCARSKFDFADGTVLALLQNGDADSPWTKTDYLAAAGMTLPLLSWQTADAHTHDYQWKYDNTEHWKECSCGFIEQGGKAAHSGTDDGDCTTAVECVCGYVTKAAETAHNWSAWTQNSGNDTHTHKCQNAGCTASETDNCSGGTATCTDKAVCEICGEKYGNTNPDNHTDTTEWIQTETKHAQKYKCCGAIVVAEENHEWENGICTECDYNCRHTYEWQSETGQYWQKCKLCDFETDKKDIPTITITGSDKVCRTQDYTFSFTLPEGATDATYGCEFPGIGFGSFTPTVENGVYSGILETVLYLDDNSFKLIVRAKTADGFEFSDEKTVTIQNEHTGGTATCTEQATCEVCGEKYGDLKPHSYSADWVTDETSHWHECTECGAKTDEAEHTDTNKDHKCDLCGKTLSEHTGGTATCTEQAVCEVCGERYGELDSNNHADMKHIEAKAATKTAEGNIEYWYCDGCGKYYKDAKATQEITKADTVTAKLPEEKPTSPKTGDSSNLALWIALLFISGGAVTATTVYCRKKKRSVK